MKFIRFLGVFAFLIPIASFGAANSDFQNASKLLSAARRGDTQTVQVLISNGVDINYTDSTGLSLVCTAVMNNDKRAIQVLQMYGADASNCDKQIQKYKRKSRVAAKGEEYNFFSGLSSSHMIVLSAVGVAAVVGGVALFTDLFKAKNNNPSSSSGGSHSGGGGGSGGSSTVAKDFTVPYGPAYLTSDGNVDTGFDIKTNLPSWDTSTAGIVTADFNYFRPDVATTDNFDVDGLPSTMQNYLLTMRGYYSLASGYLGQSIFRTSNTNVPQQPLLKDASGTPLQGTPVRVALITGNGINPTGSADSYHGIMYAVNNTATSVTPIVDKYVNNSLTVDATLTEYNEIESGGYDLSGLGTVFNPYATKTESALAKIVAGWNGGRSSDDGDLTGFVPNAQLAIYRTGNGTTWTNSSEKPEIGTFTDNDNDDVLSSGDTIVLNGTTYNMVTALSKSVASGQKTMTIAGVTYDISSNSKILIGECGTNCDDIAIYVGTDGAWYVKSSNTSEIDNVYFAISDTVYEYKTKTTNSPYTNFTAMVDAKTTSDIIANVSVLPNSTNMTYLTADNFTTMANIYGVSDLTTFYTNQISAYYGGNQGGDAHTKLFNIYNSTLPMIIMPAGDYLYRDANNNFAQVIPSATFENYAPMIYGNNLKHDFMTVVAVSHENGTSAASTITGYGDGTSSSYGPIVLSKWADSNNNAYSSRKCGIAGVGNASVDPWCFAASGPTAEMATSAAAGAVASVKSAFSYMTNDQIFTLLALTADGPYLKTNTNGMTFNTETLVSYLKTLYQLPLEYNESSLSDTDYLAAFKDVFGFGLINLERAIKPGYSIYYYSAGNIVASDGSNNKFWGNVLTSDSRSSTTNSRASTVLNGNGIIRTSFFDVLESADGSISLPRVWNSEISLNNDLRRGLYMGDVLGEFAVDSTNKHTKSVGNMSFSMSMSPRAYNDGFNGLNDLNILFSDEKYDLSAEYQRHLVGSESRFDGRANGILSLVSNAVTSGAKYKYGKFGFGASVFSGVMSDENLLENDPAISSQFEPARLGMANGGALDTSYSSDKFGFNLSIGNMHESKTVLGAMMDGLLALNGADTQYVDAFASYKPFEKVSLFARATFANTRANVGDGIISNVSDIKSNAFALGTDLYGFNFTASMPLAVVDGKMGYDYADLSVVEDNGKYVVAINNPHVEYIGMTPQKRELRFSGAYKHSLGEFTDAGLGFIYRVNPGNTDAFGNESIFMFKLHHRLGI